MRVNVIIQPCFMPHSAKRFCTLRAEIRFPVSTEKARRLRYQTGRANQAVLNPRHSVATNRQAALFAAFPITHTSPDSRSRCLISSPTVRKDAGPRRTSLPALPGRAREGIVDINIQQPIHIVDVDIFGR